MVTKVKLSLVTSQLKIPLSFWTPLNSFVDVCRLSISVFIKQNNTGIIFAVMALASPFSYNSFYSSLVK